MAIDTTSPRTRRALLGAGLGAIAATAAGTLGGSAVADATSPPVLLGGTNDALTPTVVRDNASDTAAVAISGRVTHAAGSAASAGVRGQDDGTNGTGLAGYATNGATARGVYGQSTAGRGVEGASSSGLGVYGHSPTGRGVHGASSSGVGVYGTSTSGYAVYGDSPTVGVYGNSATGYGTHGTSAANDAAGALGESSAPSGTGVVGYAFGAHGTGVHGTGSSGDGVHGTSATGYGVYGESAGVGVFGVSSADNGVLGRTASKSASGVYGECTSATLGYGVAGRAGGTNGIGVLGDSAGYGASGVAGNVSGYGGMGVHGSATGDHGSGVYGEASGQGGVSVYGDQYGTATWAGYFNGPVFIHGAAYSPIMRMMVDHPDAPADRSYEQALVGSFEQVSIISGNAVTGADGKVTVKVPALFARYHTDVRYMLTPLGRAPDLHVETKLDAKSHFTIAADLPGLEVSWQLTGVRSDPAALGQPLRVDAAKPARYRGRYIQPALYGQPRSKSLVAPRQAQTRTKSPIRPR